MQTTTADGKVFELRAESEADQLFIEALDSNGQSLRWERMVRQRIPFSSAFSNAGAVLRLGLREAAQDGHVGAVKRPNQPAAAGKRPRPIPTGRAILAPQLIEAGIKTAGAALARRALIGLLSQVVCGSTRPEQFDFWQGYAKAIRDLANGTGDKLAANDRRSGQQHQLPGALRAAAEALGDDVYWLTRTEIADRLAKAGIESALHVVPPQDLTTTSSALEDGAVAAVDRNCEQIATDYEDGAGMHHGSVATAKE